MISRAQFLGGTTLGILAASRAATPTQAEQNSRMLIATEHGITASKDSPVNQKINELIKKLADQGGGSIIFPPGMYNVDSQGIQLSNQVSIIGMGEATQFRPIGTWDELSGVFRIGSDTSPSSQPVYRTGLHDFSIKPSDNPLMHVEPIPNTVGILYNTFNGDKPADPDAAHRISGISLWDLDMGIKIKGKDDQGCMVSHIRGRRFLRSALTIGDVKENSAADNTFSMIDFSSANLSGADSANIEIYTSNCAFSQVKSWYSKRSLAFSEAEKAGAGFYVKGTRNTFNQCDAQDNGGHGFVLNLGNNSLVNCIADSNGYADNVSGAARPSEAHGFHISKNAQGTQLIGCQSFNRVKENPGQSIGFWIHEANTEVTVIGSAFANTRHSSLNGKLNQQRKNVLESHNTG
ncbi:MAG: hypothetical protein Q4C74_00915 [Rothia sp. (in: high G+C Gram-positive bacteria)]|nr:hypothetical protein [Rothia sp. (in: high G+C Gram-positive bacteria)]